MRYGNQITVPVEPQRLNRRGERLGDNKVSLREALTICE